MFKRQNLLLSVLFALALAGTASAQDRAFLSNNREFAETTYVIRFTAIENGSPRT